MTNLSLFDAPAARRDDPSTSKAAAARVASLQPKWKDKILEALTKEALTDDELCLRLMVDPRRWPSLKTARSALYKAGLVCATGEIRAHQQVWEKVL